MAGGSADLGLVNGGLDADGGVPHGARLVAFTEAAMGADDARLAGERQALRALLSPEAFFDVAGVIGAFNVVDRIADATGIPLDDAMAAMSAGVRQELDLARFASSANTPTARG